jgi:subtilisin-like proprotein convertase family protein
MAKVESNLTGLMLKQLRYSAIFLVAMLLALFLSTAYGEIPPAPAGCQPVTLNYTNSNSQIIPDENLLVSSIDVNTEAGLSVLDVNLIANIQHPKSGQLSVYLVHPGGRVIPITVKNGSNYANVFNGTLWDDDAGNINPPGPVTDTTMANNVTETTLVPESAMGLSIGKNPNGKWDLYIYDTVAGDIGALNGWSLQLTTVLDVPTTTSYAVTKSANQPITDGATVQSTLQFPNNMVVYNAKLLLQLPHTYPADLDITLSSPAGTAVTISTDNGGGVADAFSNLAFFDNGWYPVTQIDFSQFSADSAIPEEAMSAFMGEDAFGTWTLSVTDDANNDVGTLISWSLEISSATCGSSLMYATFSDGVLDPEWDFVKGTWSESNSSLVGDPGSRKALAVANLASGPCTDCSIHTSLKPNGGTLYKVSVQGWYKDRGNKIELMMKGGSNVWVLKEFVGGKMVKKMKFNELFGGNVFYDVRLQYNSSDNSVTFFRGDFAYGTMKLTAVPSGVAAIQSTGTVAEFAVFSVQQN